MQADLEACLAVAVQTARDAGVLARRLFATRKPGTFSFKGDQDFLTEADGELERLIADRLAQAFPEDGFFGEEGGGEFRRRTWVVDPIDGTANFARGIPHFGISIALVCDGRIEVGAICDPIHEELYSAARGQGAWLNGTRLAVSPTTDIRQATVELGWSKRRPMAEYAEMVARVVATGAGIMRSGSGALGLAYVAAGRIDGYAELHINAWDALAGILLVQEAGGSTNDFLANDGLRRGNPVLAATPALRETLIAATGIGS
ncbi:MAG TPA: inositol monophosphatase family protein [Hyphomicrobiaceae bacterium]|nr:inositol monophosphatase family protein [Hyphomicrobiaceae bacterium]